MKVYYHNDQDGLCSAAIVKYKFAVAECFETTYGEVPDLKTIREGETVYVVDLSFPPEIMHYLKVHHNLVWIDHHKSAIEHSKEFSWGGSNGVRDVKFSAAWLTWRHLFGDYAVMPRAVELINNYDLWKLDEDVIAFHCWIDWANLNPNNPVWNFFFEINHMESALKQGKQLYQYLCMIHRNAFKRSVEIETDNDGIKCLRINTQIVDSLVFHFLMDEWDCDMIEAYYDVGPRRYVRMRSRGDIDVSVYARRMGGGGHKNAASYSYLKGEKS